MKLTNDQLFYAIDHADLEKIQTASFESDNFFVFDDKRNLTINFESPFFAAIDCCSNYYKEQVSSEEDSSEIKTNIRPQIIALLIEKYASSNSVAKDTLLQIVNDHIDATPGIDDKNTIKTNISTNLYATRTATAAARSETDSKTSEGGGGSGYAGMTTTTAALDSSAGAGTSENDVPDKILDMILSKKKPSDIIQMLINYNVDISNLWRKNGEISVSSIIYSAIYEVANSYKIEKGQTTDAQLRMKISESLIKYALENNVIVEDKPKFIEGLNSIIEKCSIVAADGKDDFKRNFQTILNTLTPPTTVVSTTSTTTTASEAGAGAGAGAGSGSRAGSGAGEETLELLINHIKAFNVEEVRRLAEICPIQLAKPDGQYNLSSIIKPVLTNNKQQGGSYSPLTTKDLDAAVKIFSILVQKHFEQERDPCKQLRFLDSIKICVTTTGLRHGGALLSRLKDITPEELKDAGAVLELRKRIAEEDLKSIAKEDLDLTKFRTIFLNNDLDQIKELLAQKHFDWNQLISPSYPDTMLNEESPLNELFGNLLRSGRDKTRSEQLEQKCIFLVQNILENTGGALEIKQQQVDEFRNAIRTSGYNNWKSFYNAIESTFQNFKDNSTALVARIDAYEDGLRRASAESLAESERQRQGQRQ